MPEIVSTYFGRLEYRPEDTILFPRGIPGFEEETCYVGLSIPGQEPILYLQSLSRPDFCLITLPVRAVYSDYKLELPPEELSDLQLAPGAGLSIGENIACQAIVTVDETREPSANLAAPLLINLSNRRGIQVFQMNPAYSFRHALLNASTPAMACS
jgi:flagellar assembly factor FliW